MLECNSLVAGKFLKYTSGEFLVFSIPRINEFDDKLGKFWESLELSKFYKAAEFFKYKKTAFCSKNTFPKM